MGAVISFFRPARTTQGNWSQQELAEFYRVEAALIRSGMRITSEQGLSDEADPWFVFCGMNGDTFIHFARIDGNYVVASDAFDHPMRGSDFRSLLDSIAVQHPNLLPLHKTGTGTKLVIHPAALLAAIVAAAVLALSPDDALADEAGGAPTDRDTGSPLPETGKVAPEPLPAKVSGNGDAREQGGSRRQVEAVLFSAMAFAAQAAAADELDHRSAFDLPEADRGGATTSQSLQGDVGSSAATSSGSSGVQTATGQAPSSLGGTSGASTLASSTVSGPERPSAPHQDRAEISIEAPGHAKIAAADAAPAGSIDNSAVILNGATDAASTAARSSGSQHADSASDAANASDTTRDAKQAEASSSTTASIGRTSHQATVQAVPSDTSSKVTVISKKQSDEGWPRESHSGKGSQGENEGNHGSGKAEQDEHANGQSGASSSSEGNGNGNGSNGGNGQESGNSETAPGQVKKAEKAASASEPSDTTTADPSPGSGSSNAETAPGHVTKAEKPYVAAETANTMGSNDGSGHRPAKSEPAPGQAKKAEKTAEASDVSDTAGGHGSTKSEAAPGDVKHENKIAVPPGADNAKGGAHDPGGSETAPGKLKHEDKLAAEPDASATTGSGGGHGNLESAPGSTKHAPHDVGASDVSDSDTPGFGNTSGHGSNKSAPLDPSGSDRGNPPIESADANGSASETTPPPAAQGKASAPGQHKLEAQSVKGADQAPSTTPEQGKLAPLATGTKSGMAGDPASTPDKAESKQSVLAAKVDPGGNLVFASDHQDQSKGHALPPSPFPDADAHTDVGLVGIVSHHGALHDLDYHH